MARILLDISVIGILFICGMAWTVTRFAQHDRLAFIFVAVLSPVLACVSFFVVLYQIVTGDVKVGPCPPGLDLAERAVAVERQRMFGGELVEPVISARWSRAYQMELQREAERVKRVAYKLQTA